MKKEKLEAEIEEEKGTSIYKLNNQKKVTFKIEEEAEDESCDYDSESESDDDQQS